MTGLVYCAMMLFMGLAAVNTQANLLFGVFGLMVGILLVSGIISRLVLRRLRVRRVLPDHGIVGRPMPVTYEFRNDKRFWPSLSVCIAELDGVEGFAKQPTFYLLAAAAGPRRRPAKRPSQRRARRHGPRRERRHRHQPSPHPVHDGGDRLGHGQPSGRPGARHARQERARGDGRPRVGREPDAERDAGRTRAGRRCRPPQHGTCVS